MHSHRQATSRLARRPSTARMEAAALLVALAISSTSQALAVRRNLASVVQATENLRQQIHEAADNTTFVLTDSTYAWSTEIYLGSCSSSPSRCSSAKNITLQGAGMGSSVIDGGGTNYFFRVQEGGNLVLKDLTLTNGQDKFVGAIYLGSSSQFASRGKLTAERVSFVNNEGTRTAGAVNVISSSSATFTDCTFAGNTGSSTGAISVSRGGSVTFDNCTFTSNIGGSSRAGAIYASTGPVQSSKSGPISGAKSCTFYDTNSVPVCSGLACPAVTAAVPASTSPPPAPGATNPPSTTTPAPAPKVSFKSGLGGITKAEFEKAAVLAAYKQKLATEINKQSAAHAHRRRLSDVVAGDIEIKNVAANPNGGITFEIEITVEEAAKSVVYNKVDSFSHKLEESAYAATFKSELKSALNAAGAAVNDSQFDAFAIGAATQHPTFSWAGDSKSEDKVNIGAIIGGICGPLFGILGYFGWKHEQKKKNKKSNVAPNSAVAQADASAKI